MEVKKQERLQVTFMELYNSFLRKKALKYISQGVIYVQNWSEPKEELLETYPATDWHLSTDRKVRYWKLLCGSWQRWTGHLYVSTYESLIALSTAFCEVECARTPETSSLAAQAPLLLGQSFSICVPSWYWFFMGQSSQPLRRMPYRRVQSLSELRQITSIAVPLSCG